jgi:hypothetical protein
MVVRTVSRRERSAPGRRTDSLAEETNMLRSKFSAVLIALAAMLTLGAGSAAFAGTITGTVTGADGKPAKGVSVRLTKAGGEGAGNAAAKPAKEKLSKSDVEHLAKGDKPVAGEKPKRPGGGRQAVQTATTGADGTFKFENVPDGEYAIVAGGKGAGIGRTTATVSGTDPVNVTITLKERKAKA